MLRLTKLALARGTRILYDNVSLTAAPAERIGLVGANGCGKSTLFAALLDEHSTEAGDIERPTLERIAHVAQDIGATHTSALSYVLSGHAPLMAARQALDKAQSAGDNMRLADAHAHLAELDEGALIAQAHTLLNGLGFHDGDAQRLVSEFSGGWQGRLALARALMRPADLLLLDEPTNHLDLDSVLWLENWLKRQSATTLIISHDREFLDRCAQTIWHIQSPSITRYSGNYSAFELSLAERERQQDAAAKAYTRTATHLQSYVDRFRAQASKARQAQSRLKMLERLQAVEPARAHRQWRFEFAAPEKLPERLIDAEQLQLGYGQHVILRGVSFHVRAGDRIGILGVNGAGKSTLIKALCGQLTVQAGTLRQGNGLIIGYFAQHGLEGLDPEQSALEHLRQLATQTRPDAREQELRNHLGQYRFGADMATRPIGAMSGGEKARCALALISWLRPNLLVLDEPTNHLDMETREALTIALASYPGAMLLVSHDRHLLRASTDTLWIVQSGSIHPFDGDLDDYSEWVLARKRETAARADKRPAGNDKRDARRTQAEQRQRLASERKPLEKQLRKTESELAATEEALQALDATLADASFYQQPNASVASR
nr:ATP-binding cassette domain-containing protein [Burkholderiaceae bacterium]